MSRRKDHEQSRRDSIKHAAKVSKESKIRNAVYREMKYPPADDPEAEAEIRRRLKVDPEVESATPELDAVAAMDG